MHSFFFIKTQRSFLHFLYLFISFSILSRWIVSSLEFYDCIFGAMRATLRVEYAKTSPRKLRPCFLSMQILGRSNDDSILWAQIDRTNFSSVLFSSPFFYSAPTSLTLMVHARTDIRMQSKSYHFARSERNLFRVAIPSVPSSYSPRSSD